MLNSVARTCPETIVVSARELCRKGAVVLDALQREGCAILVTRYGRAAALLTPVEGRGGTARLPRPFRRLKDLEPDAGADAEGAGDCAGQDGGGQPDGDAREIAAQLEPLAREALLALADRRITSWVPAVHDESRWSKRARAVTELEKRELMRFGPSGFTITRLGTRVAAALAECGATDLPPAPTGPRSRCR